MRVAKNVDSNITTDFKGFMGDTVILQDGDFGEANRYTIKTFETNFHFLNDDDRQFYELAKENTDEFQYEPVTRNNAKDVNDKIIQDKVNEEERSDVVVDVEQQKMDNLKYELLEVRMKLPQYANENMTIVECKDGTTSYRYKNVTILQVKGKRKVKAFLTGKLLTEETFNSFSHTPEKYNATHNAYLYITTIQDVDLIMKAVDESMQQIDIKKS